MNKASIVLVIHLHQPVGNFDSVFQKVYDRCYKPFIDIVSGYPDVRMNMHISGSLMEWLEWRQPKFLSVISRLVKRGQVELIGGGFYEPILSIIPPEDRLGQIQLARQAIISRFGVDIKGAWLAERVWEPQLVSDLASSGIAYIVLDDTHFLYAGLKKEDTYGYYISEDNGASVMIFPSDKELRYSIPFGEPARTFDYMRGITQKKDKAIFTYGDDAEKFGEWPGTYKWVYEDKWLTRFMDQIVANSDWLKTVTLCECVKENNPLGRIYLPTASYEEMLEWAGGFFRNFFSKYSEANQMHKRMLYVSRLVAGCDRDEARRELYKGQCNCAYWHGVFGGLYLYHLRKAVYEHLLKAEEICGGNTGAEVADFDVDGFDEVILKNSRLWLCVKPSAGGTISEFDLKDRHVNLLNVLTRRKEAYHKKILNNAASSADGDGSSGHASIHDIARTAGGLAPKISYDRQQRAMLTDHFLGPDADLDTFRSCRFEECGDFAGSLFDFKVSGDQRESSRGGQKAPAVLMERRGMAYDAPVKLSKRIELSETGVKVKYTFENLGKSKGKFLFATELAFIMPEANSSQYSYLFGKGGRERADVDSSGSCQDVAVVEVDDKSRQAGLRIQFSDDCGLWYFPIMTISQSEKGYEENYQGSVLVPRWSLLLRPKEKSEVGLDISVT